jgi:hypothetical protein
MLKKYYIKQRYINNSSKQAIKAYCYKEIFSHGFETWMKEWMTETWVDKELVFSKLKDN